MGDFCLELIHELYPAGRGHGRSRRGRLIARGNNERRHDRILETGHAADRQFPQSSRQELDCRRRREAGAGRCRHAHLVRGRFAGRGDRAGLFRRAAAGDPRSQRLVAAAHAHLRGPAAPGRLSALDRMAHRDRRRPQAVPGAVPRRHPARILSAAAARQGFGAAACESPDRRRCRPRQDGRGRPDCARALAAPPGRHRRGRRTGIDAAAMARRTGAEIRPRFHDRRPRAPVGDAAQPRLLGQSLERRLALHRLAQRALR